jgi:hypothetical protein
MGSSHGLFARLSEIFITPERGMLQLISGHAPRGLWGEGWVGRGVWSGGCAGGQGGLAGGGARGRDKKHKT